MLSSFKEVLNWVLINNKFEHSFQLENNNRYKKSTDINEQINIQLCITVVSICSKTLSSM